MKRNAELFEYRRSQKEGRAVSVVERDGDAWSRTSGERNEGMPLAAGPLRKSCYAASEGVDRDRVDVVYGAILVDVVVHDDAGAVARLVRASNHAKRTGCERCDEELSAIHVIALRPDRVERVMPRGAMPSVY